MTNCKQTSIYIGYLMSCFIFAFDQFLKVFEIHRVLRHRRFQKRIICAEGRCSLHLAVRRPWPKVRLQIIKIRGCIRFDSRIQKSCRCILATQTCGRALSRIETLPAMGNFLKGWTLSLRAESTMTSAGINCWQIRPKFDHLKNRVA